MGDARVLVVDDDRSVTDLVEEVLKGEGWDVSAAWGGAEALTAVKTQLPDLMILDLKLPDIDGFQVLTLIREFSRIPVIALSGLRSLEDRERFLRLGGDDYITKPFESDELRFRVKAVCLRKGEGRQPPTQFDFDDGYLGIDFNARRVTAADSEVILTTKEFALLHELLINAGKALDRERLLIKVWGPEYRTDTNLLHLCVSRLRSKIEPSPPLPRYIVTLPWKGYRFQSTSV